MVFLLIILVILLILLFVPIPFKVKIHYDKDDYYIHFYNYDLYSKTGGAINKLIKKGKPKATTTNSEMNPTKKSKKTNKKKNKKRKYKISPEKLIYNFHHNKFKPHIRFKCEGEYSLGDAAATAISFGALNMLNPILYGLFGLLFRVKLLDIDLTPIFKDEFLVDLTINSIFNLNLAKIIYMAILFNKSKIKIEEVPHN